MRFPGRPHHSAPESAAPAGDKHRPLRVVQDCVRSGTDGLPEDAAALGTHYHHPRFLGRFQDGMRNRRACHYPALKAKPRRHGTGVGEGGFKDLSGLRPCFL